MSIHKRILLGMTILILLILSSCQSATQAITPEQVTAQPITPTPTEKPAYKVLWSYQMDGAIWGTATVFDGTLYVGSDDGNLYAIDTDSGELGWKFQTQGLVRSKPAIQAGVIYFASDDGYLYAVDLQRNQQVWKANIRNYSDPEKRENPGTIPDPTTFDYLQSSPVISGGLVYVGSADGNIYAVAADTGTISWAYKTDQKVRASPVVDGNTIYIGSWDGTVYAIEAESGKARWRTSIGGQIQTTAMVDEENIYIASRKASVIALNKNTGLKAWEYSYGRNNWVESSPTQTGELIYIGSSGNQYVLALERQKGELYTVYKGNVFFWSTPVIDGSMLYIGAEGFTPEKMVGGMYAFTIPTKIDYSRIDSIDLQWILPIDTTLMPDGNWAGVASSPIIDAGVIYFGGLDGKLYAIVPLSS